MIDYILELYENKTRLKGIAEEIELYRRSKSRINSAFGCAAQSVMSNNTEYDTDTNTWRNVPLTEEYIQGELDKKRKSQSNCFLYAVGVWCTAYARRRLFDDVVLKIDAPPEGLEFSAVYYDTDSVKARESDTFRAAREWSNNEIDRRLKTMCDHFGFDFERTRPRDIKGVQHPMGYWELEGENARKGAPTYSEFVTLGSKRYAYREQSDGAVYITVSGVKSSFGRKALKNDLKNFNNGLVFDYNCSGKQAAIYNDNQPEFSFRDVDGNIFTSKQRHGIILMGTTYNMTVDPLYYNLWGTLLNE